MSTIMKRDKKYIYQNGFTLVELIIAIGVFAVISISIATILINTLRGANKTNTLAGLRQNGNTLLTQMTRDIRSAVALQLPATCDATPQSTIQITTIDNVQKSYVCANNNIVDANNVSLLDASIVTTTSCTFSCSEVPGENPVATIDFTLQNATGGKMAERSGLVEFKSSVIMRNIGNR